MSTVGPIQGEGRRGFSRGISRVLHNEINIFSYNGDTLDALEGGYHVNITLALPLLPAVTTVLSSHLDRKFSPAWFSATVTVKDVDARKKFRCQK